MATYKVIQDIEAEDHILGPLSLRQFIYGLIAAFFFYLSFVSVAKHVPFLLALFLPPALFCTFFAFPFGKDQPTEVWALAKIRFLFKPRKRIWNQTGIKEQVTVTVPKKIEVQLTDGLSQMEVKSRLRALADTIDSRGWAIKNVTPSPYTRPGMLASQDSERLLSIGTIPRPVPEFEASADILDEQYSPIAQQFTSMIDASTRNHRQQLLDQLRSAAEQPAAAPTGQWFSQPASPTSQPVIAEPSADELNTQRIQSGLAAQARTHVARNSARPPSTSDDAVTSSNSSAAPANDAVTPQPDPAILNLAHNNDLNVATLAREAHKAKGFSDDDEVIISLH